MSEREDKEGFEGNMVPFRIMFASRLPARVSMSMINTMLTESVLKNIETGVKAILILYKDTFVQVMEGSRQAILDTMARIRNDRRHEFCRVLESNAISEKIIQSNWFMSFIDLNLRLVDADLVGTIEAVWDQSQVIERLHNEFIKIQVSL